MEILRRNKKEMLEIRNTVNEMKNAFLMSSLVEEAQLRKESLSLRIYQKKLLKLKTARNQTGRNEKEKNIRELWDNYIRYNTHLMGIPGEEKKGKKEIFETMMTENVSQLISDTKTQT